MFSCVMRIIESEFRCLSVSSAGCVQGFWDITDLFLRITMALLKASIPLHSSLFVFLQRWHCCWFLREWRNLWWRESVYLLPPPCQSHRVRSGQTGETLMHTGLCSHSASYPSKKTPRAWTISATYSDVILYDL